MVSVADTKRMMPRSQALGSTQTRSSSPPRRTRWASFECCLRLCLALGQCCCDSRPIWHPYRMSNPKAIGQREARTLDSRSAGACALYCDSLLPLFLFVRRLSSSFCQAPCPDWPSGGPVLSPTDPNVLARALNCTIQVRDHFEHYSPALARGSNPLLASRPGPVCCGSRRVPNAKPHCGTHRPPALASGGSSVGLTGTLGLPVGT